MSRPKEGMYSGFFNQSSNHTYVGTLHSGFGNRYEEDHVLYFDAHDRKFFIVESTELESGPNVSCSHTISHSSHEEIQKLIGEHHELRTKIDELIGRPQG